MDFYGNFSQLCKQKSMSPNGVAKILEISSGSVTNWKRGRVPNVDAVLKIAAYFHVSTDYLLGNEETSSPVEKPDPLKERFLETFDSLTPKNREIALAQLEVLRKSQEEK